MKPRHIILGSILIGGLIIAAMISTLQNNNGIEHAHRCSNISLLEIVAYSREVKGMTQTKLMALADTMKSDGEKKIIKSAIRTVYEMEVSHAEVKSWQKMYQCNERFQL